MREPSIPEAIVALARDFDNRARPRKGRYVQHPVASDENGVIALPPAPRSGGVRWGALSGGAVAVFAGTWLYRRFGKRSQGA
jgi:hypothetical protein